MAYYEVNLDALAKVIAKLDISVQAFESGLTEIGRSIDDLNKSWSGADFEEFKKSYDSGSDSIKEVGKKMANEILEYRAYFNETLKRYLDVQKDAKKYAERIVD